MKNNKKKERSIIILLIVAVVLMTVGFAAYSQTLNINGTAKVKGSPWDVRYIKDQITTTTGSVTAEAAELTDTNFTFTVKLEKPGDFYEAKFKVKNYGTIDALLDQVVMSTLTTEQAKYLDYTVTYDSDTYTQSSATGLKKDLASKAEKEVIVKVTYKQPENANELPKAAEGNEYVDVTVTGSLNYIDKTTT